MSTTHTDWDAWEREMPPPPRRWYFVSIAVAVTFVVAVIAVVIGGVVALVADAGGYDPPGPLAGAERPETTAAAPTLVPTTVEPGAPAPPLTPRTVPALPNVLVATTADGRIVVSAGASRQSADIGMVAPRLALTPDTRAAVVERWDTNGHTDLQWFDVSGQPYTVGPPFAADARYPAVSPDGRFLAYTQGYQITSTLVVRNLFDHAEKRWRFPAGHDLQLPSWGPDSRRLVMTDVVGSEHRTLVFDTASPEGDVADQASIGGPYDLAAFKGAVGTLVAIGGPAPSGLRILEVDPATGASHTVYTTPFAVKAIDADLSGEHVLFVTDKGAVYVWSNGSVYQVLDGALDAEWSTSR